MPEANIPAMKRKAAGASSMPPEMASPLVQPPAMPAAYSSNDRANESQHPAFPGLWAKDAFPLRIAVGSILLAPFQGAAGSGAEHAAKEHADQQDHAPGDAGRHDEVEIHVIESRRGNGLADHPGQVLEGPGSAQQTVAQPDRQYADDAQQDAGHIRRPQFLADLLLDPVHALSFFLNFFPRRTRKNTNYLIFCVSS